ncbi:Uncharacterised protein [Mycobacterium tuberculosis]|nr:Uncharacterised protein [Mycobacterium tuberculosis]CNN29904.1 Uncharacterised protein [Mycobacterium tuberculosis]
MSSTPATSLTASSCRSVSALRRYSGTMFSARISAGLPSVSMIRSAGMSGSAVVVQAATSCPARSAANIVASFRNSRGAGSRHGPTAAGVWAPATRPTNNPRQWLGSSLRSPPPQALAVD